MKKSIFILFSLVLTLFFVSFLTPQKANAQDCSSAYITATSSPANCPGAGQIHIKFYGAGLLLDDPSFQPKIWLQPTTPGGSIVTEISLSGTGDERTYPNVAAGTYNVEIDAFCVESGAWLVSLMTTTVTVANGYTTPLNFSGSATIKTLTCTPTGRISMNISAGKTPYEITIAGANLPAGYTATITPAISNPTFEELPAGDYTITGRDACNYTVNIPVTVEALPSGDMPYTFSSSPFISRLRNSTDCISITGAGLMSNLGIDYNEYHNLHADKYFEYAFMLDNDDSDLEWKDWTYYYLSLSSATDYQLPENYKDFCASATTVQINIRPKKCVNYNTYDLNTIMLCSDYPWSRNNIGATISYDCDSAKLLQDINSSVGVCYPADWTIYPKSDPTNIIQQGTLDGIEQTSVDPGTSGTYIYLSNNATSAIYKRGVTYVITLVDADGRTFNNFEWTPPIEAQVLSFTYDNGNTLNGPCLSSWFGITATSNILPGSTLEYVSGPADLPSLKVGETYTFPEGFGYSYYRPTGFMVMEPGAYTFKATNTCGDSWESTRYFNSFDADPFTYTSELSCEGLKIYPEGVIKEINCQTDVVTNLNTWYYISKPPTGVTVAPIRITPAEVAAGSYLLLPSPGVYTIAMNTSANSYCDFRTMQVEYVRNPLELDPEGTIAYQCELADYGQIFVKGKNGVPPYTFTITAPRDGEIGTGPWTEESDLNGQGYFANTGILGQTYTVTITDACGTSTDVPITVQNIQTANIAYLEPSHGIYCVGNEINLNAISLGAATYSWEGPCGWSSTEQNPRPVAAISPCENGGDYTLTVMPEGCTIPEIRVLNVTIAIPPTAPEEIIASSTTTCAGVSVTLTAQGGNEGDATYQWGSGNFTVCDPFFDYLIPGNTNEITVTPLVTTNYAVRRVGCGIETNCAMITITVSACFNLTYDGNGSTGGTAPEDELYNENDEVTVVAPGTLTKECHTFLGWAFTDNATTPDFAYTGTTFTPPTFPITQNTILYAVWEYECNLLKCIDTKAIPRTAEVAYTATGYTHTGSSWDAVLIPTPVADSVRYIVNGTIVSSGLGASLNSVTFPIGVSNVKVVAYYLSNTDTCEFTVTVKRVCPSISSPDGDGNVYPVYDLAGLCWTSNLFTTTYMNIDEIEFAKGYEYHPDFPNPAANLAIFGRLYTWYSAVGAAEGDNAMLPVDCQGICPDGWRLPTTAEFALLYGINANEIKSNSTAHWLAPGTDDVPYKFDARGAGKYDASINRFVELLGSTGYWACDAATGQLAPYFYITYYMENCDIVEKQTTKLDGLSVRCVLEF